MNIQRAKEEIKHTLQAYLAKDELGRYAIPAIRQRPLLLIGPPGVGKTQIMEQIARECRVGLVSYTITHHTRQSAVGLPMISKEVFEGAEYPVTEYTMSEIIASVHRCIRDTGLREGILFIDEINCVSETLAPTMLQFLQCKTFGNQAVPEGWLIVAAGNPPEYNKSVREFDVVTLDRVRRMDIQPDLAAWKQYARSAGVHGAILAYLELHPEHFYKVTRDVDGMQFVTARGWEDLSALLESYGRLGLEADEGLVGQYLQNPDIAADFAAYLSLYYKYGDDYGVEQILAGNPAPAAYARAGQAGFDERLSLVGLLLAGLDGFFAPAMRAEELADDCFAVIRQFKGDLAADGQPVEMFRAALDAREYGFVKVELLIHFIAGEDHAAARSSQCLMRGRCRHMRVRDRAGMESRRHESGDVRHIDHQIRADFVSDLAETLEIDRARVSAGAGNDHFRPALLRDLQHIVIIDHAFVIDAIRYDIEILSGHIDRRAVCQMAAVVQVHTHKSVSRLKHREKHCHVRLGA